MLLLEQSTANKAVLTTLDNAKDCTNHINLPPSRFVWPGQGYTLGADTIKKNNTTASGTVPLTKCQVHGAYNDTDQVRRQLLLPNSEYNANAVPPSEEDVAADTKIHTVAYYCRAMRPVLGLFDHYFSVFDNELEIHWGSYHKGRVLPVGTTRNAHLLGVQTMCHACYTKCMWMVNSADDSRLFKWYPLMNCETLTMGVSVQLVIVLTAFMVKLVLLWHNQLLWFFIAVLATLVFLLGYSKYLHSKRPKYFQCVHL